MNINIEKLNAATEEVKATLKDGLLTSEIWDREAGLSFVSYNPQPVAVALFTEVAKMLKSTLADSGFPGLKRYFLLDLENDHMAMLIFHGNDILQGLLMNSKKVNLGILLAVALPKAIEAVEKART
ncbi:MAG: hypothetical protein I8H87_15110 [Comamonadaceae bacterium]|nr:hypothetical protein [Comamonadaceae bacterium]